MSEQPYAASAPTIAPGVDDATSDAIVEFPLSPPSLLRSRRLWIWSLVSLVLLTDAFSTLRAMNGGVGAIVWISLGVEAVFLAMVILALHVIRRRRKIPPIVLRAEEIVLPQSFGWRGRARRVRLSDIWCLRRDSDSGWGWLTVLTRAWPFCFLYPIASFTPSAAVDDLILRVRERIEAMPGGRERLAEMDRLSHPEWAMSFRARGTAVVSAILLLVFAIEMILVAPTWPPAMVRLGANAPALVAKGEWYRVVTANLLHADARHLVSNALALLLLGAAAEGMMGTGRFFIVLLASFLAGASCSAVAACAELSVGASTGVYGLFAAIELLSWRFRDRVPRIPRVLRRLAVLAFALNVLLALSLPGVDAVAHAGGLVAGGLTAGALYAFGSPLGPREPLSRTARAVLAALSAVFAVGLALGVRAAWTGSEADELQVVAGIASREVDPNLLNNLAWGYAKDPASSSHALEVVRPLSEKAVAGKPEDAQLQDTLATVYYRLGRLDEAIDREWQAFHLEAKPYFATQLARFLRARQGGGPPLLRGGARESDVRVRIEGSGEGEAPSRWIAVDLPRGLSKGAAVFAHVREPRGREVGLLTLELGAMGSRALRLTDNRNASLAYLPEDAQVDVALIDAGGVDRESGETWWRFDPMDPKVAALP